MDVIYTNITENEKSYKKIMNQIQDLMLSGKLKKGDKLPPERQLADLLNVGRPTLKQALSALEALGLIESHHGEGNYVTLDMAAVINPFALKYYLLDGKETDLIEFRYILEVQLAKLAAVKATKSNIDSLNVIVEKMKAYDSLETRLKINLEFHFELAKINENKLIYSIYENILGLVIKQTMLTDGYFFYDSHKLIFDAIKKGDSALAGKAMSDHFVEKFPNYQYYEI